MSPSIKTASVLLWRVQCGDYLPAASHNSTLSSWTIKATNVARAILMYAPDSDVIWYNPWIKSLTQSFVTSTKRIRPLPVKRPLAGISDDAEVIWLPMGYKYQLFILRSFKPNLFLLLVWETWWILSQFYELSIFIPHRQPYCFRIWVNSARWRWTRKKKRIPNFIVLLTP